jgi:hypothetical protein
MSYPLERLRYHVTGAIERGEITAIAEIRPLLTTVPFTGFYESEHDWRINDALERMVDDDAGAVNDRLLEIAWDHVNWRKVHADYAKLYAAFFSDHIGVRLTFDDLQSPREYNFSTDRIFAYINSDDAEKLLADCDREQLAELVEQRFTSRSGFISFYSADLDDWPASVADWDHNQLGTLLECVAGDDTWLMDEANSSGELDDILYTAMDKEGRRAVDIASYLRLRQERAYHA